MTSTGAASVAGDPSALPAMPEPDVQRVSILGEESIIVGFHLTELVIRETLKVAPCSNYVLITDENLAALYLDNFVARFNAITAATSTAAPRLLTRVLPPGETTKSRAVKAQLEDFLLDNGCTRDTCLLALGGGVMGDLVGFVAATYMRGVPFIQLPTSLLAMVDSSIGGKTAVDTPHGKNLIGAFWQPRRLFIDLAYLNTLPEREFANGMAEVIKTAAIWSEDDFIKLETGARDIHDAVFAHRGANKCWQGAVCADRTAAQSLLLDVVLASARVKAHVVTVDERESGLRGLLNFGHSIGHAIEAIYTPQLLHGECVSVGMVLEAELARQLGHLKQVAVGRLVRCLNAYQLPTSLDGALRVQKIARTCTLDELMQCMQHDKKNVGRQKRVVLLAGIGRTFEPRASNVADAAIRLAMSPAVHVHPLPINADVDAPFTVKVPGSKSISNRALILAALGTGTCRLTNLLHSDDTQVMLQALQQLGAARFEWEDDGETLVVHGGGGTESLRVPDAPLYLGNAGTAARFLTAVAALVPPTANSSECTVELTGNARMQQRPIAPLVDALREHQVQINYHPEGRTGCLPLLVTPTKSGFSGGVIQLAASVSSQYVSAILLCAPYANGPEPITLALTGDKVISQPYIDMTIAMMASFGILVERVSAQEYRIPQGIYRNPDVYAVESDASSATYPLAIAAITGRTCHLDTIGAASLQGDARFAVDVLRPMGCRVVQTATSTTVQGPPRGQLCALAQIDMEPMTDAFLTASVLAAVAVGDKHGGKITRIHGIANQRVKECNRIEAMRVELSRFGVHCEELPDGIAVHARPYTELRPPVHGVHCYDDHRVAMSFSVLATALSPSIDSNDTVVCIRERRCVEKTWPMWWDDLISQIGGQVAGVDVPPLPEVAIADAPSSLVLIGMRGAGKTTLGQVAARCLSRPFIDLDHLLEQRLGTTIPELIASDGWERFRAEELALLRSVLTEEHPHGAVVACGGGVVESEKARHLLQAEYAGPVVHIQRDLDAVCAYLAKDPTRPAYAQQADPRIVYGKRAPWYKECSRYTFWSHSTSDAGAGSQSVSEEWSRVERDWLRFVHFITQQPQPQQPSASPGRYFVSLTFPDIEPVLSLLPVICSGADAVELRVDLLAAGPSGYPTEENVLRQLALLRRHIRLPIIYTVRTVGQGGQHPDSAMQAYAELCALGIRTGCEYVDLEVGQLSASGALLAHGAAEASRQLAVKRGNSRIIASFHDPHGHLSWSGPVMRQVTEQAAQLGDIVKLISYAHSLEDNYALQQFLVTQPSPDRPIIALNMGALGQLSRVLNGTLTPVTHPALPVAAAPGQLSIGEIHRARQLLGLLPARSFYLFGSPIASSPSPAMHNAGFQALQLPFTYRLHETTDIDEMRRVMAMPDFGGASVTIPNKLAVLPLLDQLSPAAQAIGAVNTVIRLAGDVQTGKLLGDNTDWLGIARCIEEVAEEARWQVNGGSISAAVVLGAGGTARAALYALHQLKVPSIYLYNRTLEKANALAEHFAPHFPVTVLERLSDLPVAVQCIIGTVPGDAQPASLEDLFKSTATAGVVVEMAYRPAETVLLKAARQHGWSVVRGVDVLVAQGLGQFQRWTDCRPPRELMRQRALQFQQERDA